MKSLEIVAALALISVSTQAHAMRTDLRSVCVSIDRQAQSLTLEARTRCLRSGTQVDANTLALSVDQDSARIHLSGEFEASYPFLIGPADCMGSRTITLTAQDILPRRYSMILGEEFLGTADFTEMSDKRHCFPISLAPANSLSARSFADWAEGGVEGWQEWRAESIPALVAPLLHGFAETMEGRPEASLTLNKVRWLPQISAKPGPFEAQGADAIAVSITRHGLLDDSVSGQRFTAIATLDGDKWRLMHLFSQDMCARGPAAGRWAPGRCP